MSLFFLNPPFPSNSIHPIPRRTAGLSSIRCSISAPEKKPRRRRKQKRGEGGDNDDSSSSFGSGEAVSALERSLRLTFMDELMERARNRDTSGVSEVIYDMIAAGLTPGPRSFHGLVVAHALNGDEQGAMHSLRKELGAGQRPLPETMIALVRLSGSKGNATRGLEILAAMEKLSYDIRQAWLILVEELMRTNHLEDANKVFLKGARGGMRATDELYDLMIEEDCKAGDHSNALDISYEMEAAGRMATTFHFNCLLSVQATCGIPEVAYATFENMEYGEVFMKPNTETYNWVIQAYTRAESYDRVQDVAELLGMMVEDHKRVQPNVKTYALLVECFTKYCVVKEAIRHFRALKKFEGGTVVLHNAGNFEDPLSLYLRALCREGRIVELIDALDAMRKDNQPIPPRAMIMSRKYRTLVSSWIEPLQEEAELGYEIDYLARYIEEGGLTGERKRWVDEEVDELICRIKLHEGDTEFWKRRFLGEGFIETSVESKETAETIATEEEVVVAETENRAEGEDLVKNKAAEAKKHLQMIGVQLLKESDEANRTKKRGKRASRMTLEVCLCICL
ncbi:PREDICTED: pentatricopeptide repeat-containing protein At5g65560-like [Camelina sativa]|uniref:Pentatricopeptide repeat-containing protein At5g65560-like n=1 Tax=Camelina sativa TaxID=90675 RepID=A0ABM1QHB8_CAMSA|nr:PREDICTED: pentatricopeptide repeat-containing protein At5g65560-like [Camelina sativa]